MDAEMIRRAFIENRVFDVLQPWKSFHPRTFWKIVEAISDLLMSQEPKIHIGRFGNGTGTNSNCTAKFQQS